MSKKEDYLFWSRALSGDLDKRNMNEGNPQCGYYRERVKTGIDAAVAYFKSPDGVMNCVRNDKALSASSGDTLWSFVCSAPVSYADYQSRLKEGRWPNDAAVLSNNPPADDSIEAIVDRLNELGREAKALCDAGAAPNQNVADQASDIANSFAEIEKRIGDLHKKEKQPFLDGGRGVDSRWFPLRDRASKVKAAIKQIVVTPFLIKLKQQQDQMRKEAEDMGVDTAVIDKEKIGAGSNKRTVALRIKVSAKITDYDAALSAVKGNAEVRELVQRLADAAARGGNPLPGTARVEIEAAA